MHEKVYFYGGKNLTKDEIQRVLKNLEIDKKNLDQRIVQTMRFIEGEKILDVGCSAGELSKQMAKMGFYVHAIDVLASSIDIAKEFNNDPKITYEVRDLLGRPFPENSFDCVTFLETIEHVENPTVYIKEFYRILKPNGHLILSTPNATSLKNLFYALSYRKKEKRNKIAKEITIEQKNTGTQIEHIFNWDFPTLIRLLDRCGFEHVDHSFARSGPIVIPFFGKKIEIISANSEIFRSLEPLKTTHIIKARKRKLI